MKEKLKKNPITKKIIDIWKYIKWKKIYKQDLTFFCKNYMESTITKGKIEYYMMWLVHSIEKGLSNRNPRPFGKEKVIKLMELIEKYENITDEKSFSYDLAINILFSYIDFYKNKNWSNNDEYKITSDFLKKYNKNSNIKAGAFDLYKQDFIENSKIDYNKFISSRHSVRNFLNGELREKDLKKAIEIASKSPSACNRQMCKIYYIKDKTKNETIIHYAQGIGGFETENINFFIITYIICAIKTIAERNQGLFNSGLLSMNFVNGLHSLGIGSCFIQFANSNKQEKELKEFLNIPSDEKIAVIIAAGYYDELSRIPYSSRKSIDDIYFER